MSTAVPTTTSCGCPECQAVISFTKAPLRGEVVRCGDCSAELEVTQVAPVTLELAPRSRKDWGE